MAAVATAALALAIALPDPRRLLHFGLPAVGDLVTAIAAVAVAVMLGTLLSRRMRQD